MFVFFYDYRELSACIFSEVTSDTFNKLNDLEDLTYL